MHSFINNKIAKSTKKELKQAKKEKLRCQKLYPDWEDNEFNCGPLKFIWGVKSWDDLTTQEANFFTLNDLDICYNRDTKKYLLGLETALQFKCVDEKITYLDNLMNKFENFMKDSENFQNSFDPYFLYLYNNGELFIADTLTELYYKFKIFVNGFKYL